MKTVIIKLGGSIITDKQHNRPVVRVATVRRLAKELQRVRRADPKMEIILLHGAGSFGHPLAHRHHLNGRPLTTEVFVPLRQILGSVRTLTTTVARIFQQIGLPVVPVDTFTAVREFSGRLQLTDCGIIKRLKTQGDIPLLPGNMVLANGRSLAIASADRLATLLARALTVTELVFATDVDGVYQRWPKGWQQPLSHINRTQLQRLVPQMTIEYSRRDVTGAMVGKLRALLALRKRSIIIGPGHKPGFLSTAVLHNMGGTEIRL